MTTLPSDAHRMQADHLPTPFSAEEIRAACAAGRLTVYRVREGDAEPYVMRWEFIAGDEHEGQARRWTEQIDGTPLTDPHESSSSWEALQGHASYRADRTTLEATRVTLECGEFDCWLYTSTGDDGMVSRAWFARTLPGPPVRFESESDGRVVYANDLIDFIDPR
jgi:hypothetical protein